MWIWVSVPGDAGASARVLCGQRLAEATGYPLDRLAKALPGPNPGTDWLLLLLRRDLSGSRDRRRSSGPATWRTKGAAPFGNPDRAVGRLKRSASAVGALRSRDVCDLIE
jgi:hypothetical protein